MKIYRLGDLVSIRTGKLDANKNVVGGAYPFFTCSVEPLNIDTYSYECECVLVAGNGDLNVKYYNGKFDAYQRTYIIESTDKNMLNTEYLYYFLEGYVEVLRNNSIGGVIKYIKLDNLTEAQIQLPRIDVQKKIVTILQKARNIIDIRNKQIESCNQIIKSQFIEMFGNPIVNPKQWELKELRECLINIENGKSFVCETNSRVGDFPAILKLSAATYGIYRPEENKALTDSELFVQTAEVHSGDLLFTRKNTPELVGMCAYVYDTPPNLMMPDLIFRLNTRENCNKIFLWQLINLDLFRGNIKNIASGSAKSMSNISKERLMQLTIPLPPIELQNEFSMFVEQTNKLKFGMEQSLKELEDNFDSLMQRAFKGELF